MAVTYRAAATALLGGITFWVTGQSTDSSVITVAFAALSTGIYYINDRAWEKSSWGRGIATTALNDKGTQS